MASFKGGMRIIRKNELVSMKMKEEGEGITGLKLFGVLKFWSTRQYQNIDLLYYVLRGLTLVPTFWCTIFRILTVYCMIIFK